MTILYILLIIFVFIISAFFVTVKFNIIYDNGLYLILKILFLKFQLYPEKLNIKEKKFTAGKLRKKRRKLRKKSKKTEKKENKKTGQKEQKKRKFSDISEMIAEIKDLAFTIIKRFFRYLTIDIKKLNIIVASDDAASTAISYGLVTQGISYLLAFFEENCKVKYGNNKDILVLCDYTKSEYSANVNIIMKIRVWQIVLILLDTAKVYVKQKLK